MESDLKPILSAIIDRLDIQSAKFEAFQHEMKTFQHETRSFQREMIEFRTETNGKLDVLTQHHSYFAGKLAQHDMELHVIRSKLLSC